MTDKPFDKRKWLTITAFIAYTLGVLSGMGIVWVNNHWVP